MTGPDRLRRPARGRRPSRPATPSSSPAPPVRSAAWSARSPRPRARPASSAAPARRRRWHGCSELGFDAAFNYNDGPVRRAARRGRRRTRDRRLLRQRRRRPPGGRAVGAHGRRPGRHVRRDRAVQRHRADAGPAQPRAGHRQAADPAGLPGQRPLAAHGRVRRDHVRLARRRHRRATTRPSWTDWRTPRRPSWTCCAATTPARCWSGSRPRHPACRRATAEAPHRNARCGALLHCYRLVTSSQQSVESL